MTYLSCEICGSSEIKVAYKGYVRDGSFGALSSEQVKVFECSSCLVQRLDEKACYPDDIYESEKYRSILKQSIDAEGFFSEHDKLQIERLKLVDPSIVRNKVVVDVGCAAGSFLDHLSGLARETIAVEPCQVYHESLRNRGHKVFSSCHHLEKESSLSADYYFSFSVIEHVLNPLYFLQDISKNMSSTSSLVISTPNRNDILMKLLPEDYSKFFYRKVHRWYFDQASLEKCANMAGLKVVKTKCVHRFGLSNAMMWLRDRKPTGQLNLVNIDANVDQAWKTNLENSGSGDYLYMWLEKK